MFMRTFMIVKDVMGPNFSLRKTPFSIHPLGPFCVWEEHIYQNRRSVPPVY